MEGEPFDQLRANGGVIERLTATAHRPHETAMADTLERLEQVIAERRSADPASSYVATLFAAGRPKIAQKLGEEAVETVIAALGQESEALTDEAADLLFHLLVLLADAGIPIADVLAELDRREGTSGIAEKAARARR